MVINSFRNLILGYVITILVILLILFYTFSILHSQERTLDKIQSSRETIKTLGSSLVSLQRFETDIFNHLHAGNNGDMGFYRDALDKFTSDSAELDRIAQYVKEKETAGQYRQLLHLQNRVKSYVPAILQTHGEAVVKLARPVIAADSLSFLVNEYRDIVLNLQNANRQIIKTSYDSNIRFSKKTFSFIKAIAVFLILVLLLNFFFHYRAIKKGEKAGQELKRLSLNLEKQVNEKTAAIIKNEEKYRRLHESMTDAYCMVDMKGQIVEFNASYKEMLGYTEEELLHKHYSELTPAKWHAVQAEITQDQILQNRYSQVFEIEYIHKSGRIFPIELRSFLLTDSSGKPEAMWAIIRDISERKKTEQQVAEAELKFRSLVEQSLVGVYIIQNEKFAYVNPQFAKMFGYAQDELINADPSVIIQECDKARVAENIRSRLSGEKASVHYQANGRKKDGDTVCIEVFCGGQLYQKTGLIGTVLDITQRKKAEEEKERTSYMLKERVKDLTTLYHTGQVLQMMDKPVDDVLKEIVSILPSGWQYPEITTACISFDDNRFCSSEMVNTYKLVAEFTAPQGKKGKIEIGYLEERPEAEEGPFLKEERDLINMLAGMIGSYLDRRYEAEALKESEANLHTIFDNTDTNYVLLSSDFKIISFNYRFREFAMKEWGVVPEEDDYVQGYFPANSRPVLSEGLKKALGGDYINYEISCLQKDNSTNWYYSRIFPVKNCQDQILGVMIAISDITDKKLMQQQMLELKIQEQKRITRAVLKAEERERNKIGHELHDNVNQILSGTKLYLSIAERDGAIKPNTIQNTIAMLDSAIEEIRALSRRQVTPLKGVNLQELVFSLAERLKDNSTMDTKVVYDVKSESMDDDLKLNIYRIVQEQTTNIIKHAGASAIGIEIKDDPHFLYASIEDNGRGFDTSKKRNGIGVSNMINRVESFNGELKIESIPGNGCRLMIKIPY